ncbi:hypothetical protein LTS18_008394, partial [Coniosporium uncinatum]
PAEPLPHEEYAEEMIKQGAIPPGMLHIRDRRYILRPEAIESVFYLYRITGSPHWRDAGWRMFQAIDAHTRTKYGHSAISDVTRPLPKKKPSPTTAEEEDEDEGTPGYQAFWQNNMESFWTAETLKYFYLLFADEGEISLDEWVFNTEAHPFRRPT